MILAYYRLLTINSLSLGSLVESLEGLVRDRDGGDDVKDLTDGISFVLELSEEFLEHSFDGSPSGEFSGEVFLSNGEISFSLLSEGFGISDVLDALGEGGSVVNNSLSGIINSLLGDGHGVSVSGKLVSFRSLGISNTLDHLSSDVSELLSKSTEHLGVSEISKLEEGHDHGTVLGVSGGTSNFLERSLDLGDLDHRGGTRVETGKELNALIDGFDGHGGFFDVSHVLGVVLSSLGGSGVHSGEGLNDKL